MASRSSTTNAHENASGHRQLGETCAREGARPEDELMGRDMLITRKLKLGLPGRETSAMIVLEALLPVAAPSDRASDRAIDARGRVPWDRQGHPAPSPCLADLGPGGLD